VRVGKETPASFNFCPLKAGGPLSQAFSAACQFSLFRTLSLRLTLRHYTTPLAYINNSVLSLLVLLFFPLA